MTLTVDEKLTLLQLLQILGRLSVGAAWTLTATTAALLVAAGSAGGALRHAEDQERVLDLRGQLLASQSSTRDVQADLKGAKSEAAELRDLNEQKVCANWTIRERSLAVRRLKTAVAHLQRDLVAHAYDPQENTIPMFTYHFYGLDGLDPNVFSDDEATLDDAHELANVTSLLNSITWGACRGSISYSNVPGPHGSGFRRAENELHEEP